MFTNFKLIFLVVTSWVKCQEEKPLWDIHCDTFENVTQATKTIFSATLRSECREESNPTFRCEITYLFVTLHSEIPIPVIGDDANKSGQHNFDGITLNYRWMIENDEYVMFNVTLNSSDLPVIVNIKIQNLQKACLASFEIASIEFRECQKTSRFSIVPQIPHIASYLDIGYITCDDNQNMNGRAIYSNGSEAIQTRCLYNATWENAEDITCLYPIHAEIHVRGDPYIETITWFYNQAVGESNVIILDCSTNKSNQTRTGQQFLLQREMLDGPNITLRPNLNGENVSCYFENNYTQHFNDTYLSTSTLNITFDPIPPHNDSFCSFPNGSIIFYSNPPADESSLALLKGNEKIASQITECCGMQYGVLRQTISPYNYSAANDNLTLRANYSGHPTFFNVTPCDSVLITTGTDSSSGSGSGSGSESGKTDLSVIILACAGGVSILILIVLILICRRRNSKGKVTSGGNKVENVNPLYGTSDDVALESKSDEQVVNPLYGTTDGETEVYSVVDKKNKKGKANKPQKPTKGSEDLYSSVDKRKGKSKGKENSEYEADDKADATYSVVDKKKKGAQKANESTTADVDTYAVVDRTNKKRKGAGDDDLHGSTSQE